MKKYISFILFFLFSASLYAQDVSQVKKSPDYIYSEATGSSMEEADSLALEGMVRKISESLKFPYSRAVSEAVVRTYLDDMKRVCGVFPITEKSGFSSVRYLRKDRLCSVFRNRISKVTEMERLAMSAEKSLRLDVALRYWSWRAVLLRSICPVNDAEINEAEGHVRSIMDGMNVSFDRQNKYDKSLVELNFTYRGSPVRNIDYRFWNGKKWSGILSAKDSKGYVEVDGDSRIEDYKVRYEVSPAHLMHIFREVGMVEKALGTESVSSDTAARNASVPSAEMSGRTQSIDFSSVKEKVLEIASRDKYAVGRDSTSLSIKPVLYPEKYEAAVEEICAAVRSGRLDSVKSCFTDEGYEMFNRLAGYGKARVLSYDALQCYELGAEVYCRSVPMAFSFSGNGREFVEDLVFAFNGEGKVCSFSFALSSASVKSITSHDNWSPEARMIIVSFLENYKTAYALKRLDYISSIFDDDALIITGHVLKNTAERREYGTNPYVVYTRHNKKSYIERLEKVFDSQEFINLQFSDSKVIKLGKGEQLFGIQLRQEYWSASYSDTGYLFLLVDLAEPDRPVIHVRTWQEAPDKEYGIIGPYHF